MAHAAPQRKYYKKTPGFATTKGQTYEFKVAGLLYLRCLNNGINFRLATNLRGAGAFDDIVFKIEGHNGKWTSYFIQLKHKDKASYILQLTNPKQKELFLPKYFDSHQVIKAAMSANESEAMFEGDFQDCVFVMYTNAKVEDLGESRCESEEIKELFGLETGQFFKFDSEGESESGNAIADLWEKYSRENKLNKDAETQRKLETDWKDFVHRLCIFSAQPSGAELDALLADELRKAVGDENKIASINHLCAYFMESVKSWWEDQQYVLNQQSDLFTNALNRVLAEYAHLRELILAEVHSQATFQPACGRRRNLGRFVVAAPTSVHDCLQIAKMSRSTKDRGNGILEFLLKMQKVAEDKLRDAYESQDWEKMDEMLEYIDDTKCLQGDKYRPFDDCRILENDLHRLLAYCLDHRPNQYNERTIHKVKYDNPYCVNGLLAVACHQGSLRIVKMLLDRGFNVNGLEYSDRFDFASRRRDPNPYPPLVCAARGGHLEVVKLLVERAKASLSPSPDGQSRLRLAEFLNRRVSSSGETALLNACEYKHTEIVTFLINSGADMMMHDFRGRTCLHYSIAGSEDKTDLLRMLLARVSQADRARLVASVDCTGATALHYAAQRSREPPVLSFWSGWLGVDLERRWLEMVKLLVDAGGKATRIRYQKTALYWEVKNGAMVEHVQPWLGGKNMRYDYIFSKAVDAIRVNEGVKWIDVRDYRGRSALNVAQLKGHLDVVEFLKQQGADASGPNFMMAFSNMFRGAGLAFNLHGIGRP